MATILVVEDDVKIARLLQLELMHAGYAVEVEHDGRTGLERALQGGIDLMLLDVMLPHMSGLEVVRRIKAEQPTLPVLMVTARGDRYDKVSGLDLGADDYITKPFEMEELLARIRAFLRMGRHGQPPSPRRPPRHRHHRESGRACARRGRHHGEQKHDPIRSGITVRHERDSSRHSGDDDAWLQRRRYA